MSRFGRFFGKNVKTMSENFKPQPSQFKVSNLLFGIIKPEQNKRAGEHK